MMARKPLVGSQRQIAAFGIWVLVLTSCASTSSSSDGPASAPQGIQATPAAFPGGNGKIAYEDDGQITVIEPDGSGKVQLTSGSYPAWSADGTKIAYVLGASLFIMNADGSGQTLVQGPISDRIFEYRHPAWSPDGTQIVFAVGFHDGRDRSELYVVDVDGPDLTEITPGRLQGWWPSWSPDGTLIAFRTGWRRGLATMSPDGSNLTLFPGLADYADWSPDSSQIIFMGGRGDVFRINSDGTGRTNLTDGKGGFFPVYSPDGTQIAFRGGGGFHAYIVTMSIGGTDVVRVTEVDHVEDSLSWQPT